jgi:SAM-dependent methyltransferase
MAYYGEDLAYIHDAGFGAYARQAAPGLLDLFRRAGLHGGLVVDLGCGSGILARRLTGARYRVLGIDQSASLLRLARKGAPRAVFRRGSFLKLPLPPCRAVVAVGECLNYQFGPRHSRAALARLFARVYRALAAGGLLVFDVALPGQVRGRNPLRHWREGKDWAVLVEVRENAGLLSRRIVSFRKVGRGYRRDEEVHRLQLYPATELTDLLRQAGFRVRLRRGYGTFRLPGRRAVLIAVKP